MPRAALARFEALSGDTLSELRIRAIRRLAGAGMQVRASVDRVASEVRMACWRSVACAGSLTPMWRAYQGMRFRTTHDVDWIDGLWEFCLGQEVVVPRGGVARRRAARGRGRVADLPIGSFSSPVRRGTSAARWTAVPSAGPASCWSTGGATSWRRHSAPRPRSGCSRQRTCSTRPTPTSPCGRRSRGSSGCTCSAT